MRRIFLITLLVVLNQYAFGTNPSIVRTEERYSAHPAPRSNASHPYHSQSTLAHGGAANTSNGDLRENIDVLDSVFVIGHSIPNEKRFYDYDDFGNRIFELHEHLMTTNSWMEIARYHTEYNSEGDVILEFSEHFNGFNWVNYDHQIYDYDSNGDLILDEFKHWSRSASAWSYYYRKTFSYDDNGNLDTLSTFTPVDSSWREAARDTYTYDDIGNRTSFLYELFDYDSMALTNEERDTFTYDAQGNLATVFSELWRNSAWETWHRSSYGYDNQAKMTFEVFELWVNSEWRNSHQYIWTYNGAGSMTSETRAYGSGSDWINQYQRVWTFDTDGQLSTRLSSSWDGSTWENNVRVSFFYDSDGQLITKLFEEWENSAWVNEEQYRYTYDSNGNIQSFNCESWYGSEWHPSGGGVDIVDRMGNDDHFWGSSVDFYYTTVVKFDEGQEVKILDYSISQNYPNPFNPTTTISYSLPDQSLVNLSIFDIQGREVVILQNNEKPAGHYEVQWNGLDQQGNQVSTGVYFCRLDAGSYSQTVKMVFLR